MVNYRVTKDKAGYEYLIGIKGYNRNVNTEYTDIAGIYPNNPCDNSIAYADNKVISRKEAVRIFKRLRSEG